VSLVSLLTRRPLIVALAGPNGAGKSTFFDAHLAQAGLHFVNADVLALSLGGSPYLAADLADRLRRELVGMRESFIFETVFSDPAGDKLAFLKSAETAGYTVLLIYVGVANAEMSNERVAMRAAAGGHDIPAQKLYDRYPRSLMNLKHALTTLSNVWVYDHSDLDRGYVLVASRANRESVASYGKIPDWLHPLLP